MSERETIFADGMFVEKPSENAPDFIKLGISIKVAEFTEFLKKHEKASGYVNLNLKKSKGGKLYVDLNDFKPKKDEKSEDDINPSDIPF